MTSKEGPELRTEETPPKDSSMTKEEATTGEKKRAPEEEGKEEDVKNCKAEHEDSKVDGFGQNSPRGVLENPMFFAGSDDSNSCDTFSTDETLSSDKEQDEHNSKSEPDGSKVEGDVNSPGVVPDNSVSSSSDSEKSTSTATLSMDQTAVPEKEKDVQNSKAEPDDSKVDVSSQNSTRGVLENAISSAYSEGSSTDDTSSVDQTLAADKEEQNSNAEPGSDSKFHDSHQNSPRGVLENAVSPAYSDGSSGSDTSSLDQAVAPYGTGLESHSLNWRNLISRLITRKKRSVLRLPTFPMAMRSSSLRRALERIKSSKDQIEIGGIAIDAGISKPPWRSFDYEELVTATNGFSQENLIGKGGHAEVYKGTLVDGQLVAVKKLTKGDNEETRVADFLSELGIIAHVNHPNAAQLVGFSVERGLHLVLRFSAHGSLASVLHGSKESLEWKARFSIAMGVAEGLLYLHEGCQRRIIHRDIKASNILLGEDYQPQISDFGLAKWLPDNWKHHVVFPIEGTFGYMAPEYFMHGVMNEKTDVFAFGVVLLELITGRLAVDFSRQSLVIWAKPLLEANKVRELVDPALSDAYDQKEATRALRIASMCIHHLSTSRPSMKEVVRLLRIDDGTIELMQQASRSKVSRLPLIEAPGTDEDYTCSRYLNDLHRHKQLALEQ